MSEDKPIPHPTTASDYNAWIETEVEKQGSTVAELAARTRDEKGRFISLTAKNQDTRPEVEVTEESDAVEMTTLINGREMSFTGANSDEVARQIDAALRASAPAVEVKTDPKPAGMTDLELQDLGYRLQLGDLDAIDSYLDKSGALDKYFEKRGVKLDDLKAASTERITNQVNASWESATKEFVAAHQDYPRSDQNLKLMQYKLSEMAASGQVEPSVDSLNKAYESLKADGLIITAPASGSSRKKFSSTTLVGTDAYAHTRQHDKNALTISRAQVAKMTPQQIAQFVNDNLANGASLDSVVNITQ